MPQANSTTSCPRLTSPRASDTTLPCSLVRILASSPLRSLSSSRNANRIWVRLASEVSRQPGNAAAAASITARASSAVARATSPVTSPVAGLVTGAVAVLVPANSSLFIQCWIVLALLMFSSLSVLRAVFRHGLQLVAGHLVRGLVLGEDRRHHHGVGPVVEADFGQAAEEVIPVDVTVTDLQVLMHPDRVPRRVGDVPQAVAAVIVLGGCGVHQAQLVACGAHDV